jgi:integrase/recombinase XerD
MRQQQQQALSKRQQIVTAHDIHHYDRRLKGALAALEQDETVIPKNRETIRSYVKFRAAQGLSVPRQARYIYSLRKLSRLLKDKCYEEAVKDDIVNVVSQLEDEDTAYETKHTEKTCIKCFYRWLRGGEDGDEYPSEVKWIKNKRTLNHSILPDDLLTEDEIRLMAESCPNPRDPALILLIYETGGRIGEALSLSVGSVRFDKYGAVLIMAGKTGGRRVRIIFSARALAGWLNHHPAPEDPNAPLWTNFESVGSVQRLEYGACRKMLTEAAKRCRINKRVNPHSFRHARASNLANVLTEAQMNEYLGWIPSSRMPAVYVHLSGRNLDNALFKLNGIKTEKEVNQEERPLKPQQCERCSEVNPPTNKFCARCGAPLDLQTAINLQNARESTDEIMANLMKDPGFLTTLQAFIANQFSRPHSSVVSS